MIKFIYCSDCCLFWTINEWHMRGRPRVEGKEMKQENERLSLQLTEKSRCFSKMRGLAHWLLSCFWHSGRYHINSEGCYTGRYMGLQEGLVKC